MDTQNLPLEAFSQRGMRESSAAPASDTVHVLWFLSGLVTEPNVVRTILIHSSPYSVGRRQDQQLCLEAPTVSSRHAEFLEDGDRLLLRDLQSTNGTFVNGHRIHEVTELAESDLIQFGELAFRVRRQVSAAQAHTQCQHFYDQALSLVQFDRLLNERAVTPVYQPIVELGTAAVVGQEVLARSSILGLEMPQAMFQAAAQLDLALELSRMFRWEGIRCARPVAEPSWLFVNTHPCELAAPGLVDSLHAVRQVCPRQPLVLEVHEAAITNAELMRELRTALHDLDIRLAYDDFGAGQNRLVELIEVPPDYLKFDKALIRDLDQSPRRQQLIKTLVQMAQDLHITTVAEGIETLEEAKACQDVGFELGQGFLFGKPAHQTDTF